MRRSARTRVWIDGKRHALAHVEIDADGRARATASTIAMRDVARSSRSSICRSCGIACVTSSDRSSGRVDDEGGDTHELEDVVGIAEDYDTWW